MDPTLCHFFHVSEFKVTIINEEDSVMTTCKPNNICMRIWNKQGAVKARPPANAANWQPDSKRKNDQPGNFHFTYGIIDLYHYIIFTINVPAF